MTGPKGRGTSTSSGGYPSVTIGGKEYYPDNTGLLHSTVEGAISANQRMEPDLSRGASGGCGQDPSKASSGKSN